MPEHLRGLSIGVAGLFIGLASVESMAGYFPTYFDVFMPLLGFLYFTGAMAINWLVLPIVALAAIGVANFIFLGLPLESFLRSIHFLLMIVFGLWVSKQPYQAIIVAVSVASFVCLGLFIIELMLKDHLRTVNLSHIYQNSGGKNGFLLNKSGNNFAGAFAGVLAVLNFSLRRYILGFLILAVSVLCGSKGLIAGYAVLLIVLFGYWIGEAALTKITAIFLGFYMIQPAAVLFIHEVVPDDLRNEMIGISGRYVSFVAHAEMGLDKPFGVGYAQGINQAEYYFGGIIPKEAHSLPMQVFGEFGVFGYSLFILFLITLFKKMLRFYPLGVPLIVFVLVTHMFLNALTSWAVWVPIGYVLANIRENERHLG